MKDATATPEHSPLDSERFGVSVFRWTVADGADLEAGLAHARRHRAELLIARCRTADIAVAHAMEEAGFRLMDTLLWLRRRLPFPPPPPDEEIVARPCRPADLDEARALARRAFRGYAGHYAADPRLERAAVDEVYSSWLEHSWPDPETERDRNVFLAFLEGTVVGFLTAVRRSPKTGELPIGGTAPEVQARGLTRRVTGRLAAASMDWLHAGGASVVETSVHAFNLPMQRILVRMGFEPFHSEYTFHKWFPHR